MHDLIKNKWALLGFLCAIFVIYTIDRSLLGILADPIQKETGLSNVRFGVLSAAIFWGYALVVPFSGLAGDRFDRTRLIGIAVVAWSAMTVVAGFAGGFWSLLLLASIGIVVPQTLYGPSANALIAELHDETRTLAMSCHQAAYYTGWFVSGGAVALVVSLFGTWRAAYFAFGGLGLIAGLLFLLLTRAKPEQPANPAQPTTPTKPTLGESFRAYFGCPSAVLVSLGYVADVFVSFGYCAWGPKFIAQKFSISSAAAGTGVMFWHFAASFAAILVTGVVTDRYIRRWPRFRLVLGMASLALMVPMLALFGLASSLPVVWVAAAIYGIARGIYGANQVTVIFDFVSSRYRSGAIGFLNVIAGLVGSTAPILLGWLSEPTRLGLRGFEIGFAALGAAQAAAIAAFAIVYEIPAFRAGVLNKRNMI